MGNFEEGTPLRWPEIVAEVQRIRQLAIQELLAIWQATKDRKDDPFLWGDETESLVVQFQDDKKTVTVSKRQSETLNALEGSQNADKRRCISEDHQHCDCSKSLKHTRPIFEPEFGSFMLESMPGKPWGSSLNDLLLWEQEMAGRRRIVKPHLRKNEYMLTLTNFPLHGDERTRNDVSTSAHTENMRSQFVPDDTVNSFVRYRIISENMRLRRGRKVALNIPVFQDENTKWPWRDPTVNHSLNRYPEDKELALEDNYIYMDAPTFGVGLCCLQVTLQAKDVDEARKLYDQLVPLGPIMLALTAATPIFKGFLASTDTRWEAASAAADDRTLAERGETDTEGHQRLALKPRFSSVETYIARDSRLREEFQDPDLVFDSNIKERLVDHGMDSLLATHFAIILGRDPLMAFREDLKLHDPTQSNHFNGLQALSWKTVRLKPPPLDNTIGWRVEFRPMEVQITDFENTAFAIFVVLLARTILTLDLNLYIPIKMVATNMEVANRMDAAANDKFYFRRNPLSPDASSANTSEPQDFGLLDLNTIMNGKDEGGGFSGLITLIEKYLVTTDLDSGTCEAIGQYLKFVSERASGKTPTIASSIRSFVAHHPDYMKDSVVSPRVGYDLLKKVQEITEIGGRSASYL